MCTNRATVESLECYVDEIVECFEDFVKKSLIVISVGIGLIVVLLMYLLKRVCERQQASNVIPVPVQEQQTALDKIEQRSVKYEQDKDNSKDSSPSSDDEMSQDSKISKLNTEKNTTGVNTLATLPSLPSFDEEDLRNIGLVSCAKAGCGICPPNEKPCYIPSRISIPNIPTYIPKRKSTNSIHLCKNRGPPTKLNSKSFTSKGSCCSVCCNNEQKR